MAEKNVLIIR